MKLHVHAKRMKLHQNTHTNTYEKLHEKRVQYCAASYTALMWLEAVGQKKLQYKFRTCCSKRNKKNTYTNQILHETFSSN